MPGVLFSLLGKHICSKELYSEWRYQKQYRRIVLLVQKPEAWLTVVEQVSQGVELSQKGWVEMCESR